MSETNWIASRLETTTHPADAQKHYDDCAAMVAKIKNLSAAERQAITSRVFNASGNIEEATAAVLQEISDLRARHPEQFSKPKPAAKIVTPAPAAPAAPTAAIRTTPAAPSNSTGKPKPAHKPLTDAEVLKVAEQQSRLVRQLTSGDPTNPMMLALNRGAAFIV